MVRRKQKKSCERNDDRAEKSKKKNDSALSLSRSPPLFFTHFLSFLPSRRFSRVSFLLFLYLRKDEVLLCCQLLAQEEPQGRNCVGQGARQRDEASSSTTTAASDGGDGRRSIKDNFASSISRGRCSPSPRLPRHRRGSKQRFERLSRLGQGQRVCCSGAAVSINHRR